VLPFILEIARWHRRRLLAPGLFRALAVFVAGLTVALLPVAAAALPAPESFWFGNFVYPGVSRTYHLAGGSGPLDLPHRLAKVFGLAMKPRMAALTLLFIILSAWCTREYARGNREGYGRVVRDLLILAFVVWGAVAPARVHPQYLYAPAAFMVIAVGSGVRCLLVNGCWSLRATQAVAALAVIALALGYTGYRQPLRLFSPRSWVTSQVAVLSDEVARLAAGGRVLTLAPLFPLLGGADTYPAFVNSPFVWRTAPNLSAEDRLRFGIVGPDELDGLLASAPPAGVLLGFEPAALERPLREYARLRCFHPIPLPALGDLRPELLVPHSAAGAANLPSAKRAEPS
jgi:hypothetical protein